MLYGVERHVDMLYCVERHVDMLYCVERHVDMLYCVERHVDMLYCVERHVDMLSCGERHVDMSTSEENMFALRASSSLSKNLFMTTQNDGAVLRRKWYIKCKESPEIFRENVMHNHDEDTEASLNRQILNNAVKMKAMEELCVRPGKLIHKLVKINRTLAGTFTERAPPNFFLSQQTKTLMRR
jgi:hypothetical protein